MSRYDFLNNIENINVDSVDELEELYYDCDTIEEYDLIQ